jgi:hypothetical protein
VPRETTEQMHARDICRYLLAKLTPGQVTVHYNLVRGYMTTNWNTQQAVKCLEPLASLSKLASVRIRANNLRDAISPLICAKDRQAF